MTVSDPVSNSVQLTDLRPFTLYNLSLRTRKGIEDDEGERGGGATSSVVTTLNFSTAGKTNSFIATIITIVYVVLCIHTVLYSRTESNLRRSIRKCGTSCAMKTSSK